MTNTKIKTHELILNLLDSKPMTRYELGKRLKEKLISLSNSVLYEHLNRAVKNYELAFLSRSNDKTQNKNAEEVINSYDKPENYIVGVGAISWEKTKHHIFIRTKKSQELFRTLNKKFPLSSKNMINELASLYRALEVFSIYQKALLTSEDIIKNQLRYKKQDYSKEKIQARIKQAKITAHNFSRFRNKHILINVINNLTGEDKSEEFKKFFLKTIKLDDFMSWVFYANLNRFDKEGRLIEGLSKNILKMLFQLFMDSIRKP